MQDKQVKQILILIENAYPNFLPNDHEKAKSKVNLWRTFLSKWEYAAVMTNLSRHIADSKFEPRISELNPRSVTLDKAWMQKLEELQ